MSMEPLQGIVDKTVETFGKVDILVNNAGIIRREDAINFTEKDWDDVMNINSKTVFFLSQAAAKQFIAQGTGGKIVSVAVITSYSIHYTKLYDEKAFLRKYLKSISYRSSAYIILL